jgi:hypothetical protein
LSLKPELDSGLKAEVALAVIAAGKVVAEARQYITRIHDPDGDLLSHREVNAATNIESKRIVAGDFEPQMPEIWLQAFP